MLFKRHILEKIATGEVTLAFRQWTKPTVRAGGSLRTAAGVLAIDHVDAIPPSAISEHEARRAGHASRASLIEELGKRSDGELYRIAFRLAGPDPRATLRDASALSAGDRADIA